MTLACRVLFVVAVVMASLPLHRTAVASPTRVTLVRPQTARPAVAQALTRIQGELTADGFEVVLVDSPALDASSTFGDAGRDEGAQASIGLFIDEAGRTAELRVIDHLTNKAVVRRTPIDETDTRKAAEVLAVRAVELLRASLLELMIEESPPPGSPSPRVADVRQAAKWAARGVRPEHTSRWSVEAGAAVIGSLGGIGPAVVTVLRGRFAVAGTFTVRATLAGLGTNPRVEGPTGSAVVAQDMGLAEIVATPWSPGLLRPTFSLGLGTLYTSVDGQATFPYVSRRSAQWALAADAGAGVALAISSRFGLALEVHALVARPYPVVRFLDDEVARGGQPSIVATLTLLGSP